VAALAGLKPVAWLEAPGLAWAGLVVAATGIAGTLVPQLGMGSSWRVGVDETERTDLVTRGPFPVVRNPIFTVVALTGAGLVLMAPNVVALAGFAMPLLALQLQVRIVEEPYLLRTHGARYATYAARVGRFVPAVGRLTSQTKAPAGTGSACGERPPRLTDLLPPVRTIY
jgi:protein-S-isoprenylcysteine O-methyltransferase Ste14